MAGLEDLPDDVLQDILYRLPGRCLTRLKLVSKTFHSAISQLKFKSRLVFLPPLDQTSRFHSISGDEVSLVSEENIPTPWVCYDPIIAGSCNGFLLIVMDESFFLWNPFTRYLSKVLELDLLNDRDYDFTCFGLCYDNSSHDYKVVVALANRNQRYADQFVLVSSLKAKRWTIIMFPYNVGCVRKGPLLQGRLHCMVRSLNLGEYDGCDKIVYFDQVTNEFKDDDIPMPKPKYRDTNLVCGLGVLGGNLCIVCWDNESDDFENGKLEVMVMKEYGVPESWTHLFSISMSRLIIKNFKPYSDVLNPVCFTKDTEVIMNYIGKYGIEDVLGYNSTRHTCRQDIDFLNVGSRRTAIYEQTLNSPGDYYWDENIHSQQCRIYCSWRQPASCWKVKGNKAIFAPPSNIEKKKWPLN